MKTPTKNGICEFNKDGVRKHDYEEKVDIVTGKTMRICKKCCTCIVKSQKK